MQHAKTKKLVTMAMLAAISTILVAFVHIPIIPAAPFLMYDPADVPILIGTFAFGPGWGALLTVVVSIIQGTFFSSDGIVGMLMHILATGSFVLVTGLLYGRNKSRKNAILALIFGSLTMTITMVLWNLAITPFYMGVPISVVMNLLPAILAFNLIKAGGNAIITFFLYKPIHNIIIKM